MKNPISFAKIIIPILATGMTQFSEARSNEGRGGGDSYTIDFIQTVALEIYPHARKYPVKYRATAAQLLDAADPERVVSKKNVYESCDDSKNGREVEMCYNPEEDTFRISRELYPIDKKNSQAKRAAIVHELYRRLKIEGDKYHETKQTRFDESEENDILPIHGAMVELEYGIGITKFASTNFIKVKGGSKVKFVFGSTGALFANVSSIAVKEMTGQNQVPHLSDHDMIEFSKNSISKDFVFQKDTKYLVSFKGQAQSMPVPFSEPISNQFTLSLKLIDETGRTIVDYGDVPILAFRNGKFLKNCCRSDFETLGGAMVKLSETKIDGAIYIHAE